MFAPKKLDLVVDLLELGRTVTRTSPETCESFCHNASRKIRLHHICLPQTAQIGFEIVVTQPDQTLESWTFTFPERVQQ